MNITSLSRLAKFVFVLSMSSLYTFQITAQRVETRISTDSLTVGEIFKISLHLQYNQEYSEVEFPDNNSFYSSFELIERQQFKVSEFSDSLVYTLQFFGNEDQQIAPLPVTIYSGEDSTVIYTEPIILYFKTVVAESDTSLKSMKPNFEFPRVWWPWVLCALLVAALLLWWIKYRKKPEEKEPETKPVIKPFYNPLEELDRKLSAIKKDTNVAESKDFKLFYSQIGDAIRSYFEELYKIPALESTSTELLRYLDAYGVDDTLTEKTREVLRKADLVKFAKFNPTIKDAWKTYDSAVEFLERAKLADSARISRLKAEYNRQFMIKSSQTETTDEEI